MRQLIRYGLILVLVLSLGLHWALLQSVAWMGMVVSYSQKASITEAIDQTFDGKHPCPMCKAIKSASAEGKEKSEKQKPSSSSKLDPGLVWQGVAFIFDSSSPRISSANTDAPARLAEPPKPRPRLA